MHLLRDLAPTHISLNLEDVDVVHSGAKQEVVDLQHLRSDLTVSPAPQSTIIDVRL